MSGKKAKQARQQARVSPPVKAGSGKASFWTSWQGLAVIAGVVAIIAASFVLPGILNKKATSAGAEHAMAMGAEQGKGLPVGSTVPAFSERDLAGQTISARSVYGKKTLLFFSEGVMCQACFEQIQGLQQVGRELQKRGIQLVSVTPDSPSDLEQAASQYGITTPLISDQSRQMSEAFNTLGLGMHADTPGHAFALIYRGKVLWYRDYWLPPDRSMYVEPAKLLKDIPS